MCNPEPVQAAKQSRCFPEVCCRPGFPKLHWFAADIRAVEDSISDGDQIWNLRQVFRNGECPGFSRQEVPGDPANGKCGGSRISPHDKPGGGFDEVRPPENVFLQ